MVSRSLDQDAPAFPRLERHPALAVLDPRAQVLLRQAVLRGAELDGTVGQLVVDREDGQVVAPNEGDPARAARPKVARPTRRLPPSANSIDTLMAISPAPTITIGPFTRLAIEPFVHLKNNLLSDRDNWHAPRVIHQVGRNTSE